MDQERVEKVVPKVVVPKVVPKEQEVTLPVPKVVPKEVVPKVVPKEQQVTLPVPKVVPKEQPTKEEPTQPTPVPTTPSSVCLIAIGMAGSGKTSLIQRINSYLHSIKKSKYLVNLDPATLDTPFNANIDIRDTISYKQVMKNYKLGPNGAILTSLNLFTTKFDQVLDLIIKRNSEFVVIDTPGQIEIFTWSASGSIITETISSLFPTVILYVIDTPRSTSPTTFMSNMLYCCSILYKTKLPFILVFNKSDCVSPDFMIEWMQDFELFQQALEEDNYMSSLIHSMSMILSEFYEHLRVVGVSAATGEGMQDLFIQIENAKQEYYTDFKPNIEKNIKKNQDLKDLKKKENLDKFMEDLKLNVSSRNENESEGEKYVGKQEDLSFQRFLNKQG